MYVRCGYVVCEVWVYYVMRYVYVCEVWVYYVMRYVGMCLQPSTPCEDIRHTVLWVEENSKKKKLLALLREEKHFK